MTRRTTMIAVLAALAVLLAAGGWWLWLRSRDPVTAAMQGDVEAAGDVRAPEGVRIRVQVVNTTKTRGLARRATLYLRDRGFDVVEIGGGGPERGETLVLDRSGHAAWARLVAAAMGGATVEARPDTSRYLDVTVLLGRSWRPPPQPLYP
jgi:hypothetical protein